MQNLMYFNFQMVNENLIVCRMMSGMDCAQLQIINTGFDSNCFENGLDLIAIVISN